MKRKLKVAILKIKRSTISRLQALMGVIILIMLILLIIEVVEAIAPFIMFLLVLFITVAGFITKKGALVSSAGIILYIASWILSSLEIYPIICLICSGLGIILWISALYFTLAFKNGSPLPG